MMITDLIQAGDYDKEDGEGRQWARANWKQQVISSRDCLVKAVPLTAIKIVVVVWQIVTQVCTVILVYITTVGTQFICDILCIYIYVLNATTKV